MPARTWDDTSCAAVALLFAALTLHGQSPEGEIRVQVKDPSGAAMEASGKLESLAPGVRRSFQTDAQGTYTLGNLPYGRYRLEISKTGFATQSVLIDVQSATPISRTRHDGAGLADFQSGCGLGDAACRNGSRDRPDRGPRPDGHGGRHRKQRRARSWRIS